MKHSVLFFSPTLQAWTVCWRNTVNERGGLKMPFHAAAISLHLVNLNEKLPGQELSTLAGQHIPEKMVFMPVPTSLWVPGISHAPLPLQLCLLPSTGEDTPASIWPVPRLQRCENQQSEGSTGAASQATPLLKMCMFLLLRLSRNNAVVCLFSSVNILQNKTVWRRAAV